MDLIINTSSVSAFPCASRKSLVFYIRICMFRTHGAHGPQGFFDGLQWLSQALAQLVEDSCSWAATFYRAVFCRILELLFAPVYSDDGASRPVASGGICVTVKSCECYDGGGVRWRWVMV